MVVAPVWLLAPESTSVPLPLLTMAPPLPPAAPPSWITPEMALSRFRPPSVRVLPPRRTSPAPSSEPMALAPVRETSTKPALATFRSASVAPAPTRRPASAPTRTAPLPSAPVVCMSIRPWRRSVPPEKPLAVVSSSVPAPVLTRPWLPPLSPMAPDWRTLPPSTLSVAVPVRVIALAICATRVVS